jgi:hypothetical protein
MMTKRLGSGLLWGSALCVTLAVGGASAVAQTTGQSMPTAGHPTTHVAEDAGNGIKRGTSSAYRKTSKGTKTAYHKTQQGAKKTLQETGHDVAKVGDKMAGKPAPQ